MIRMRSTVGVQNEDVINYYRHCPGYNKQSPFKPSLKELDGFLHNIEGSVKKLVSLARKMYSSTKLEPMLTNLENGSFSAIILQENVERNLKCDSLNRFLL